MCTYSLSGNFSVAGLQYSISPFASTDITVSNTGLYFITLTGSKCIWRYAIKNNENKHLCCDIRKNTGKNLVLWKLRVIAVTSYLFWDDWFIRTRSCIIYVHRWGIPITYGKPSFDIPLFIDPFSTTRNIRKVDHGHHVIIDNIIYFHRLIIWNRATKQAIQANLHDWTKSRLMTALTNRILTNVNKTRWKVKNLIMIAA